MKFNPSVPQQNQKDQNKQTILDFINGLPAKEKEILLNNQYMAIRLLALYSQEGFIREFNRIKKSAAKIFKEPSAYVIWSLSYLYYINNNPLIEAETYAFLATLKLNTSKSRLLTFKESYLQANNAYPDYLIETNSSKQVSLRDLDEDRIKWCCINAYTYTMLMHSKNINNIPTIASKLTLLLTQTKEAISAIIMTGLRLSGKKIAVTSGIQNNDLVTFSEAYSAYWQKENPSRTKTAAASYAKGISLAKKTLHDEKDLELYANIYIKAKEIHIPDDYLEVFSNACITYHKAAKTSDDTSNISDDTLNHGRTAVSDKIKEELWKLHNYKDLQDGKIELSLIAGSKLTSDSKKTILTDNDKKTLENKYVDFRLANQNPVDAFTQALHSLFFVLGHNYVVQYLKLNQNYSIAFNLKEPVQIAASDEEQAIHFIKAYSKAREEGELHEDAIEYANDMLALFRDNLAYFEKQHAKKINNSEESSNGAYDIAKNYDLSPFYMRKFCQYYNAYLMDPEKNTSDKVTAAKEALKALYLEEYYYNDSNIFNSKLFKRLSTSENNDAIQTTLDVLKTSESLINEITPQIKESEKNKFSQAFNLTFFKAGDDDESGNSLPPSPRKAEKSPVTTQQDDITECNFSPH